MFKDSKWSEMPRKTKQSLYTPEGPKGKEVSKDSEPLHHSHNFEKLGKEVAARKGDNLTKSSPAGTCQSLDLYVYTVFIRLMTSSQIM